MQSATFTAHARREPLCVHAEEHAPLTVTLATRGMEANASPVQQEKACWATEAA